MCSKRIASVILPALLAASALAQSTRIFDDRSFPSDAGETQSTVVAPGHEHCPAGRILATNDRVRPHATSGIVMYRDLNDLLAAAQPSTFHQMPDKDNYWVGTADHDLVSLSNGNVLYLTGAFSRTVLPHAWWGAAYRQSFGPGARSILLVWRSTNCGKDFHFAQELAFDSALVGDGTCAMPQRPRIFRHDAAGSANLTVPLQGFASGEQGWRRCRKCQQLVLQGNAKPACPAGGEHSLVDQPLELLQSGIDGHADDSFQRCKRCGALFDAENGVSECAAATGHDGSSSADYFLIHGNAPAGSPAEIQEGWRWCSKCHSLHFETAGSSCLTGLEHDGNSWHYQVPLAGSKFGGETGWRRCSKCRQLFFADGGQLAVCAKGGAHLTDGTQQYQLPTTKPVPPAQAGWKRCSKCASLFSGSGHCPAVLPHDGTGSLDYHLAHEEGTPLPNLMAQWRTCSKCRSVYFSGHPGAACAAGQQGNEKPFYDMGGTDGQLVTVDRANDRMYLSFQCVGFHEQTGTPHFELGNTPVNRTLIAMSDNGAPWQLLAETEPRVWRMGLVPLPDEQLALGFSSTIAVAKKNPSGTWELDGTGGDAGPGQAGWEEFDATLPPQNLIDTNVLKHTVIARTPGAKGVLMAMPDTTPNGHGYRLFFYDPAKDEFTEAKVPIVPASKKPSDFVFHLRAIDFGTGPVLLYWNDVDGANVTVRGRLVTGHDRYRKDMILSRSGGQPRSFALTSVPEPYWYGDYQTAGGYRTTGKFGDKFVYRPVWVEPDKTLHYGHVEFTPALELVLVPHFFRAGVTRTAKRVRLSGMSAGEETLAHGAARR